MPNDYIFAARKVTDGKFEAEPGPIKYLSVPKTMNDYTPAQIVTSRVQWTDEVIGLADGDENPYSISPKGDILVFVHGYNNTTESVLQRHRLLTSKLRDAGWHGVVISFDWPSNSQVLNYLEDRSDAAATAGLLVRQGLDIVVRAQSRGCLTNIHLLGHSTGAYVIMKAFEQARDFGPHYKADWRLGQVAFISGDVSQSSVAPTTVFMEVAEKRIMRLTNYANPYDAVLAVSVAKRLGVSPRAGRKGIDTSTSTRLVNVNCGEYFHGLDPAARDDGASWSHSWYFGDETFALDLAMTLEGAVDRDFLPTREKKPDGLHLKPGKRPEKMEDWGIKVAAKKTLLPDGGRRS
jgi:pimeloyl-ACP methyl ester carboxylesterase